MSQSPTKPLESAVHKLRKKINRWLARWIPDILKSSVKWYTLESLRARLNARFDVPSLPALVRNVRLLHMHVKPNDYQDDRVLAIRPWAIPLTITVGFLADHGVECAVVVQPLESPLMIAEEPSADDGLECAILDQPLATPLMIAEGPSADDGNMLHDVDARQPVDPQRCFNIGDRVRVFEGTHACIRGYRAIANEGIISSSANGY